MPNRFDVSIDGTEHRLIRGEGSYQQGASRAMVDFQEIETMEGTQLSSRNDVRSLFQTSWAGGSRWEKPLLSSASVDSYYQSSDFDMLVEPGSLLPRANVTTKALSLLHASSQFIQTDYKTAYAVGEKATNYSVVKWDDGVISKLANDTGLTGVPLDVCWDDDNATLFFAGGSNLTYVTPDSASGTVAGWGTFAGGSIFMHLGQLHHWNGRLLYRITDPLGTPTRELVFDDGFDHDWLDGIQVGDWLYPFSNTLAISTSDGIYVVKNVLQGGTVVAYIYRVDRDAAGTDIGTPVATLSPGYVALDIYWSLGSLLISATTDLGILGLNDGTEPAATIDFFHLTQNQLGSIGSPLGNEPNEIAFKMLTSHHSNLLIGGSQNVWAFDPVRGGLHMLHEDTTLINGHYQSVIKASDGAYIYHADGTLCNETFLPVSKATTTATDASLESNYFDFSLTGETKYVTEVTIMPTELQTGETWTISLEADDGSWTVIATFTSGGTQKAILSSPVAGYRFRYKIEYATSQAQATPSKLKGILFRSLSGEMVPFWQLMIDGTEARNVENEIVRPEDVFSHMKTLRDTKTPVTFIDNYEADDRSSSSTYEVRVHSVTIVKEEPKEATIQVVLVGI